MLYTCFDEDYYLVTGVMRQGQCQGQGRRRKEEEERKKKTCLPPIFEKVCLFVFSREVSRSVFQTEEEER